jgi:pSer/pThr/pTyr-binding forkhead associated (FHA) protein
MQSQDNDKTVIGGLTLNFLYSIISEDDKHYPIEDKVNIGRGADSAVLIDDKKISRNHAVIAINEGRLQLTDLKSSNGTFLNGKKITESTNLTNGDLIAFEKHIFTVKIEIKEDEVIEEEQEAEEDNDHTSIVEMSDEYFNKLNNAVGNFEDAVKPEAPKTPESELPKPEAPKIPEPKAPKPAEVKKPEPEAPKSVEAKTPEPEMPKPVAPVTPEPVASKAPSSNDQDKKDIPSSWIEDSAPVDGTRMMDLSELNALRESTTTKKEVTTNDSSVSRLHCFIEGQAEEIIELAISDFNQASGWEIGRDSQCDIVLDHPSVSNRHAQIVHQSGRWKMVNLVSTNGIVINGQKKLTSYLSDGDKIGLGSVDLVFKASKSAQKNVKKSNKPVSKSNSSIPIIPIALGLILIVLATLIYLYLQ